MNTVINISSSLKDYLEAIYSLSRGTGEVRITDVAAYLSISKPSTNRAVKNLKNLGLVNHEHYGNITLTPLGENLGREFHNRHKMITSFLVSVLKVPYETAKNDAASIEHDLSSDTINGMMSYMQG